MAADYTDTVPNGTTVDEESATVVQQKNSEEWVEDIVTRRRRGGVMDGIKVEDPQSYLGRVSLVQKAIDLARQAGILVISSPPGTGKASLLQLMMKSLRQKKEEDNINIYGVIVRPSRPSKPEFDLFDYVRDRIGVCYDEKVICDNLQSYSEIWLLFDDAQRLCRQKFHEFWQDVVKTHNSIGFGGGVSVVVVVSATYYLTNEDDYPISLRCQPRIEVEDLLLTQDEAKELFELRFVYPKWHTYESVLFHLTNGNAAAFALGMDLIAFKTLTVDNKAEERLEEESAVQELFEGTAFLESLERCFPLKTLDAESHLQILDSIVHAYKVDVGEGFTPSALDTDSINKLKKAGILSKNNRFTSPAAASFYYSFVFPRASLCSEPPETLTGLVTRATSKLSARRLRVAR